MIINELFDFVGIEQFSDATLRAAFGRSLKELREYKGLTQKGLAEATGVPRQSISVYERGEVAPTITQAIRLAYYFSVTVGDFIYYGLKVNGLNLDEHKSIIEKHIVATL